jgi:hypothetical protein
VNSLSVLLLLPVENRVFVLGQHFLLTRHLRVPSLHGLCGYLAIALEGIEHGIDDIIDGSETFALASLLRSGESPWDLPVGFVRSLSILYGHGMGIGGLAEGQTHQRRPPSKGELGLNMAGCEDGRLSRMEKARRVALRLIEASRDEKWPGPCTVDRVFSSRMIGSDSNSFFLFLPE